MRQHNTESQRAAVEVTQTTRLQIWLVKGLAAAEEYAIYLFLGLMIVGMSAISPYFLTPENMINVARQVSIGAIVAFGMMIPLLAGEFDISVGSNMGLASALTIGLISYGLLPTILVVLGSGLLTGFINGLFTTRGKIPSFIVTLSTQVILRGIVFLYTRGNSSLVPSGAPELFMFLGKGYVGPVPFLVIVMLVIFGLCAFVLSWTKFGRTIYCIGGNREAARFSGINTDRQVIYAFILSAMFSSFGGILLASRLSSNQPTAGTGAELDALAAMAIGGAKLSGGKGSVARTLVGVFIIGFISNGINLLAVETFYQNVVKGAIILFAVLFDRLRESQR